MTRGQTILVLTCTAALLGLFFFGKTVEQKETSTVDHPLANTISNGFSFEKYNAEKKESLFPELKDSIEKMESALAGLKENKERIIYLDKLAASWENNGNFALASEYWKQKSVISKSAADWNKTGRKYFTALKSGEDTSITAHLTDEAFASFKTASKLDSSNLEYSVDYAESIIELSPGPMEGILLLLELVKKEPENIRINLLLGRMSIMSGQFEKAVKRLETVLKIEPENTEALYYLGGAFNSLGQKEKAIEIFKKTRALIKNPEFRKEIDAYINTLDK